MSKKKGTTYENGKQKEKGLTAEESHKKHGDLPWLQDEPIGPTGKSGPQPIGCCCIGQDIVAINVTAAECTRLGGTWWCQGGPANCGRVEFAVAGATRTVGKKTAGKTKPE